VGVSTATIGVFKIEEFCKRGYSPPKIFEPTRRQFCVTNGRLYRPMSQVALQRSRVGTAKLTVFASCETAVAAADFKRQTNQWTNKTGHLIEDVKKRTGRQ
jgi:hypothetical protein